MRLLSKITLAAGVMFSLSSQAAVCPKAEPASSPNFCASFKAAAECHCRASGLRPEMCVNYNSIYQRMIVTFGSLQRACEYQHDTSTQECMNDWNCFRSGGVTSTSELCSGTGAACG